MGIPTFSNPKIGETMLGGEKIGESPDAQIVICENQAIADIVTPVLAGKDVTGIVIVVSEDGDAYDAFSNRDIIGIGKLWELDIWAASPKRFRTCTDPLPETFTLEWLKAHLQPYNPESATQGVAQTNPLPDGDEGSPPTSPSEPVVVDHNESEVRLLSGDSEVRPSGPISAASDLPVIWATITSHAAFLLESMGADADQFDKLTNERIGTKTVIVVPSASQAGAEKRALRAMHKLGAKAVVLKASLGGALDLADLIELRGAEVSLESLAIETIGETDPETDLQAIGAIPGTEDIGEPPEYVTEGPEPRLNGHDSVSYEGSMIWTRPVSNGWPEPQNVWGSNEPPKEFDIENLFPGFMADYGADCSVLKGTDKGIAGSGLLGAFSAWIHESFRMQIKVKDTTWKEHARLWTFNEGESASGKTPGLNLVLAPAYALNDKAGAEDAHKIARWLSDKRTRDLKVADYEKRAASNPSKLAAGEQLPPFVDSIEVDNRMFKGANVEGARDKLQTTPKIWLVTQELATWLSSFGRYAPNKSAEGGDRAFWMDSFDGSLQAPELRSGREIQSKASCVITANITGSSLRKMLGNASMEGDGLAQRFIPNHCRLQQADSDHEQAPAPLEAVTRALANLRTMKPDGGLPLRLHPDGYVYFQEFLKRLHYQTANGFYSPNCKSALVKYQSHAPRIALTLHLAMLAERNFQPGAGEYVSLECMKMACQICEAWIPHTIYFWENTLSDGGQVDEDVKEVCEVIVCYWLDAETVPLERLLNSWKAGKKRTGQELSRIMADVCGAGWLDDDPMGRRSRRGGELKTSYSVNPKLKRIWDKTEFATNARRRRMETGKKFSEMRAD